MTSGLDRPGRGPISGPLSFLVPFVAIAIFASPSLAQDVAVLPVTDEMLVDLGLGAVDLQRREVARAFYSAGHPDDYDFLVVFTDFPVALAGAQAAAIYVPVRNEVTGIGQDLDGQFPEVYDLSAEFGSGGRLQGVLLMGNAAVYPEDPYDQDFSLGFSPLNLLGQETLHRFGVFVNYRDEAGEFRDDLRGRGGAHWSHFFHSGGSDLEGNDWVEGPAGTFTSGGYGGRFNQLDQYLMGLRLPSQVDAPHFLIEDPQPVSPAAASADTGPRNAAVVRGRAVPVTVQQIIDAHGPRLPSARVAPKAFRQAFVLLSDPEQPDSARERARTRVERLRRTWPGYFYTAGEGRARVVASLDGADELLAFGFSTSAEGFEVEGGELESGIDVGLLRVVPNAPQVVFRRSDLRVPAERFTRVDVVLRATGKSSAPCGAAMELQLGESSVPVLVAMDGQAHTYSVAVSTDVDSLALTLDVEAISQVELLAVNAVQASSPDLDADGVVDELDNCPREPNPVQFDGDGNGVGDACEGARACGSPRPPPPPDCACRTAATPSAWIWRRR